MDAKAIETLKEVSKKLFDLTEEVEEVARWVQVGVERRYRWGQAPDGWEGDVKSLHETLGKVLSVLETAQMDFEIGSGLADAVRIAEAERRVEVATARLAVAAAAAAEAEKAVEEAKEWLRVEQAEAD